MRDTQEFALSLGAKHISLNSFTPLPGSALWNKLRNTYSEKELLSNYNQLNPTASFINKMSPDEYKRVFIDILSKIENYNEEF